MKKFYKRFACLVLALVLLVVFVPDLTPKAQAAVGVDVGSTVIEITAIDARTIINACNEYAKIGALETTIASGALTGTALANAKSILSSLKTGVASYGISATTCANVLATWALAGVVIEIVDWGSYWQMLFDNEAYKEGYVYTNNPMSNFIVNNTHADDWAKKFIDWTGVSGDAWDWDYVEMTDKGWLAIYDWTNSIFGDKETEETQTLPPLDHKEILDLSDCAKVYSYYSSNHGNCDVYEVPVGWGITHPTTGNFRMQAMVNGYYSVYGTTQDGTLKYDFETSKSISSTGNWRMLLVFADRKKVVFVDRAPNGVVTGGWSDFFLNWGEASYDSLFSPSVPYRSGFTVSRKIPDLLGGASRSWELDPDPDPEPQPQPEPSPSPTVKPKPDVEDPPIPFPEPVRFPTVPDSDKKTPEQNLEEFIRMLDGYTITRQIVDMFPDNPTEPEPQPEPSPSPSPTPKPDTETTTEPDDTTTPKPDDSDNTTKKKLDFSPLMSFGDLSKMFPFSLPWDLIGVFKSLSAPRQTPKVDIQLPDFMFKAQVVIDLAVWDGIAVLIRNLILGLFIVGLVLVSSRIIKW